MTGGRLIAVVGPSGVGKDSVMDGIVAARPDISLVQRTITRPHDLGGEDYIAATPEAFSKVAETGGFCLHWGAHGLFYGIPAQVQTDVENGALCLVNLSRGVIKQAGAIFPDLTVLHITARPETIARRLTARGRETASDIAQRIARTAAPFPETVNVIEVPNDGTLPDAISAALIAIDSPNEIPPPS